VLPIASMQRSTLSELGLLVFVFLFVSFVFRGFGQFVLGQHLSWQLGVAAALVAAGLVAVVVGFWVLAQVGVTALEDG
jgi:hypothetical protein